MQSGVNALQAQQQSQELRRQLSFSTKALDTLRQDISAVNINNEQAYQVLFASLVVVQLM